MKSEEKYQQFKELHDKGLSYTEIAKQCNSTKSLVAYYLGSRWEQEKEQRIQREKDQQEYENIVVELIKDSKNINEVCNKLGIRGTNTNYERIIKIIDKYQIDTSHFCIDFTQRKSKNYTKEDIFKENSTYQKSKLKDKLIEFHIKEWKCEKCGRTEWEGEKIPLETHHINGINTDNRIENLQLLCPNCHAITDNYCGKNIKTSAKLPIKHNIKHCKFCSKEFFGQSDYCSQECSQKALQQTRNQNRLKKNTEAKLDYPTKEWLENAIKTRPFTDIANEFGVTDNAVKRWCKKYNLPSTKTELGLFNKTPIPIQYCKICGKEFKPTYREQVYCSKECKAQAQKLKPILNEQGIPIISKERLLEVWNKHKTKSKLYEILNIKRNALNTLCEYYNIILE